MDYEVKMFKDIHSLYEHPFKALESLRELMRVKLESEGENILNYITQTINDGDGMRMIATFSEERKKHFEDNPL